MRRRSCLFNDTSGIFLFLHIDKCCGYSLEAPRWGASNEYPQHASLWRNEKYYPRIIIKYSSLTSPLGFNFRKVFHDFWNYMNRLYVYEYGYSGQVWSEKDPISCSFHSVGSLPHIKCSTVLQYTKFDSLIGLVCFVLICSSPLLLLVLRGWGWGGGGWGGGGGGRWLCSVIMAFPG